MHSLVTTYHHLILKITISLNITCLFLTYCFLPFSLTDRVLIKKWVIRITTGSWYRINKPLQELKGTRDRFSYRSLFQQEDSPRARHPGSTQASPAPWCVGRARGRGRRPESWGSPQPPRTSPPTSTVASTPAGAATTRTPLATSLQYKHCIHRQTA